jgi:hypothetical protein
MAVQTRLSSVSFKNFALDSPFMLSSVSFLVLVLLIRFFLSRPKKLELPTVGKARSEDYRQALVEGTARVNSIRL